MSRGAFIALAKRFITGAPYGCLPGRSGQRIRGSVMKMVATYAREGDKLPPSWSPVLLRKWFGEVCDRIEGTRTTIAWTDRVLGHTARLVAATRAVL